MVNIEKQYYSTSECAEVLHVSRITIFNWIQKRKINAKKIAGNYVIAKEIIESMQKDRGLRDEEKKLLRIFAHRLLQDYGEFLKIID